MNRLLFPGPTRDLARVREIYGDVSVLNTTGYLYGLRPGQEHLIELEHGRRIIAALEAIGEADDKGQRQVMCTLNGQLRPVRVRDRSIVAQVVSAEKADPGQPGHVAAPFAGVVSLSVEAGHVVEAGQPVATIEAMKMEAAITAPVAGSVQRLALASVQQVEGGDLVLVIGP